MGRGKKDRHHRRRRGRGRRRRGQKRPSHDKPHGRASLYVTTVGEALSNCLDLSTPLCQRGEGAARRLLLDFSGWASNPEDSAAMILL